jgi:translation initiation factor 4E
VSAPSASLRTGVSNVSSETIKRALSLPSDTRIEWKSHDDSIAQRSAIDQARHEKTGHHGAEKRRVPLSAEEHSTPAKEKPSGGI